MHHCTIKKHRLPGLGAGERTCLATLLIAMLLLAMTGCTPAGVGTSIKYSIKGEHFLRLEDPVSGAETFREEVAREPNNPLSNYYYGRILLRQDKAREALPFLEKARDLKPTDADLQFWAGLAQDQLKQPKQARERYEQALLLAPKHLQALTFMGHNLLRAKRYDEALDYYQRALKIWPQSPSVLYNRALALSRLKRTPEEQLAWHHYLAWHPSGALARKAVEYLNATGDYSYRNYLLGSRTVTVEKISFEPFSATLEAGSEESLQLIGTVAKKMQSRILQVVMYQKNNEELAKERAQAIGRYLAGKYPELQVRIRLSWFGVGERIEKGRRPVDESVAFFMTTK